MKKFLTGMICLALCGSIALSSCSKKEEVKEETETDNTENGISSIVLPEEESEEEKAIFEYDFSKDGAVLIAYYGEDEEVILEEKPIRMKKEKQEKIVTEEVKNADGTVSTVEKKVEETVEVPVEYTLVGIDDGVFMYNETAKKIVIPDTVTEIGDACFQNATALEEVVLPAGLTEIKDMSFHGCSNLKTLNIPETVTSIGMFAFGDYFTVTPWYNSLKDESVIVGDGILLKYNGNAKNVKYGDEVKKVAYYAFLDTKVETVTFTEAVEEIDALSTYRSAATIMLPETSKLVSSLRMNNVKVGTYAVEAAE